MVSKCKDAKQRKKEKDTAMQKNISLVQDVKRQMVLDDRLPLGSRMVLIKRED